ncbi:MAG: SDR family oxidoreductase [Planctomycetota bacterium]|jgi:dTDP-4-dehydrorhamnose reductase
MKTERVFVTGCGGMLGNAVYPYFSSLYAEVLATDKVLTEDWLVRLDVRDEVHLSRIFADYKPQLVIHLAAETDLEFCELNADIAKDTNSTATQTIAKLCEQHGATLVYISTAGVFDGLKEGLYTEEDKPNPIMVYGRTKHEGEVDSLKHCSRSFVVRAGWMMGGGEAKEKKFIYKILQQLGDGKSEIFAVNDKWGTPTYTYDFAKNLFQLIKTNAYGVYHMACEGRGTRFDVAQEILKVCKRNDTKLTAVSSDFFRKEYFAPRPPSEMMYNANLRKLGLNNMRPWQLSLKEYIETCFPAYIVEPPGQDVTVGQKGGVDIREIRRPASPERTTVLEDFEKEGKLKHG